MVNESPYMLTKNLEQETASLLVKVDIYNAEKSLSQQLLALKKQLTEARLYARDYELSETRDEQLDNAKDGRELLERIRQAILAISEHNIFSPVEVASLTARLELIAQRLA